MLQIKKRGLSSRLNIFTYANFGFTDTLTSACGIEPNVSMYRNSIGLYYGRATLLAEDSDFTIPAPAGYYSEFDADAETSISRYWDGTEFVGLPDFCE
jgi:hypothetical protein